MMNQSHHYKPAYYTGLSTPRPLSVEARCCYNTENGTLVHKRSRSPLLYLCACYSLLPISVMILGPSYSDEAAILVNFVYEL